MHVKLLRLSNFRNYTRLELPLQSGLTVLFGQNAQGKTNVLEAISMLSVGSSYRASSDREVIRWGALPEERVASLRAEVTPANADEPFVVELLVADMPGLSTKRVLINNAGKRVGDLVGRLTSVFFGPEQLDLVIGSPHYRRDFLDGAISQVDRGYHRSLSQYARVLHQRNQLLKQFHERQFNPEELVFWDDQMVEHGSFILARRATALLELITFAAAHHQRLAPGRGELQLQYETKLFRDAAGWRSLAEVTLDAVAAEYRRCLAQERERELGQGASVVGPHRDDIIIELDGKLVEKFGSRGQQRTAALALKLAELDFIEHHTGDRPLLLLDDVLSELDVHRRRALAEVIASQEQVLLTTTEHVDLHSIASYEVQAGELTKR